MTNPVQVHRGSRATSTVVALHCSLGSGRHWASLAEELAGKYVFIAPDISGYGNAAGASGLPMTLAEEVHLLKDRIDDAVGPIHLVGHSYGGAVAFKIATDSRLAHRVCSLTLIEPVLPTILRESGPDRPLYDHFVRLAEAVYEDLWNGVPWNAIDKFATFWRGSEPNQEIPPKSRLRLIEHAEKLAFDFAAVLAEQHVTAAATAIKVPTLLVSGGLSPYMTQRIVWRLTNAITGVRTHHLPTAGHMLPLSHSAAVIPEIVRHIALADLLEQRSALQPGGPLPADHLTGA